MWRKNSLFIQKCDREIVWRNWEKVANNVISAQKILVIKLNNKTVEIKARVRFRTFFLILRIFWYKYTKKSERARRKWGKKSKESEWREFSILLKNLEKSLLGIDESRLFDPHSSSLSALHLHNVLPFPVSQFDLFLKMMSARRRASLVPRDMDYERDNIAYHEGDLGGVGTKCKNFTICKGVLAPDWWSIKGRYICNNCDIEGWGVLSFPESPVECPICLEVKPGISMPVRCQHATCIDCFRRLHMIVEVNNFPYSVDEPLCYDHIELLRNYLDNPGDPYWDIHHPSLRSWHNPDVNISRRARYEAIGALSLYEGDGGEQGVGNSACSTCRRMHSPDWMLEPLADWICIAQYSEILILRGNVMSLSEM